jgi:glutaminase
MSMLKSIVENVHQAVRPKDDGEVASYIPELAEADPDDFGLAVAPFAGDVYTAGDVDRPFTIQSVSKAFTFGLALRECGPDRTFEHVGTEPSGDDFNAITLNPSTGVPYNPMVNAGAMAMTSLIRDVRGEDAFDFIREEFGKFAGSPVGFDDQTYESELRTADRNRAVAYLMRSRGVIRGPVEEVVDLYTRQCSLTVTARQLATMGGTVANVGVNPATNVPVVDPLTVRHMLSVMFTCGMYNYAGRWAVDVGLPAKSGVSGGILAVVNRQVGIASYSPRLDPLGNSVRGIQACARLAEELGLHAFEFSNAGSSLLEAYLK